MLDDSNPGIDNGIQTWFAEPHHVCSAVSAGGYAKNMGTFRSSNCRRVGHFAENMCTDCKQIPKLRSFRQRAIRRSKNTTDGIRNISKINDKYLSQAESESKMDKHQKEKRLNESKVFFLKNENLRMRLQVRSQQEKLKEFAQRGSLKAVCFHLNKAANEGKLKDKTVLTSFLETVGHNLHVSSHGKRYQSSLQMFYEVILLWGGPRIANFVAMNMFGPEIHTIFRWRKEHTKPLILGLSEQNFIVMQEIYLNTMKNDLPRVPVLIAEDETAVEGKIEYDQAKDAMLGFCGRQGIDHQCEDNVEIVVGDGEHGYQQIVDAFQTYKIGTQARVMIINPLHPDMPKLPILMHPTCNRFDSEFVKGQWDQTDHLYITHIEASIGPLIGRSSDGDARRRKLMLLNASSLQGHRYQPIPREYGFIFSCRKETHQDESYSIRDLFDQDFIHNVKKMINHLYHATREMKIGPYDVHKNHIAQVYQVFGIVEHGLSQEDVLRNDRQNFRSAQRVCFSKVQDCLKKLIDGDQEGRVPDQSYTGTWVFLQVVWHYVEIFLSGKASLMERIKYASLVCHFLGIWHNHVKRNGLLSKHFLSRETYTDVLLSCHSAVILICFMRDNFPNVHCHLSLTGSDCCESFFSKNGQWVGNRHNYTFARMERNRSHMIRLEQIWVNPNAPVFARPHPKGEFIWTRQYAEDWVQADLSQYPAQGSEIHAWNDGAQMAQHLAEVASMVVANYGQGNRQCDDQDPRDDDIIEEHRWFFQPFHDAHPLYAEPASDHSQSDEVDGEEDELDQTEISTTDLLEGSSTDVRALLQQEGLDMACDIDLTSMIDEPSSDFVAQKSSPTITVPESNKTIYKATLIETLNVNPFLSKDRLTRVKQKQEYHGVTSQMAGDSNESVCLFDDYIFINKQQKNYSLGQVNRMSCKGKDYVRPVPIGDKSDVTLYVSPYQVIDVEDDEHDKNSAFYVKMKETLKRKSQDVISSISLSVCSDGTHLAASKNDLKQVEDQVSRICQPANVTRSTHARARQYEEDDGRRVQVIEPVITSSVASGAVRRSSRRKTKISFCM